MADDKANEEPTVSDEASEEKPAARKEAAKKPAAKKPAASKATPSKTAADEPAKEPAATKPAAKKPAAKQTAAKKPAAKETAAKKPAATKAETGTVAIRTPDGKTKGKVELPAEVFDVTANIPLMHQVVVAQLAAARAGTHDTKTRGEVAGGGSKPYRQKGTGRARQGSIRAPQYVGGGTVHGPTPRDYTQRTPKKMKAAALRGALSDRARAGRVHVISGLVSGDTPSTKSARKVLESLGADAKLLVVLGRGDEVSRRSVRNLPSVHVISPDQLNTYDVLVNDDVVFTSEALETFLAGPARGRGAKATATSGEVQAAEEVQ